MENTKASQNKKVYQIRLKGRIDPKWSGWFEDFSITHCGQDETLLVGAVVDQSALHGVLLKISNLGIPIISINPVEADSPETTNLAGE
jgi:hypothetical protein